MQCPGEQGAVTRRPRGREAGHYAPLPSESKALCPGWEDRSAARGPGHPGTPRSSDAAGTEPAPRTLV